MSQHCSAGVWWMCFFPCLGCNNWDLEATNLAESPLPTMTAKNTHLTCQLVLCRPLKIQNTANEFPDDTKIF